MRRVLGFGLAAASAVASVCGQTQRLKSGDREVTACLDRARPALRAHLKGARGDVLALVCLAALHDEFDREDKVFAAALRRLRKTVLKGTYGAALRLMVRAHTPDVFDEDDEAHREERVERDVKRILLNRYRGGFTYAKRSGYLDLSNTQYAALGLRAAVSLGAEIDRKVWRKMRGAVLKMQSENGGWSRVRLQPQE